MSKVQSWWNSLPRSTIILVLDWVIVIAAAILLVVIYVPKSIWAEEEDYRNESRRRMQIISTAQEVYHTVTGSYTTDGDLLFKLVEQLHDSLIADTTFIGDQIIRIDGMPNPVNIPEGLGSQLDTTFTVGRPLRREVPDTTYTYVLWNDERPGYDTLYVNGIQRLQSIMRDSLFEGVIDTSYGSHRELFIDYKWNRYHLEPELLYCPVIAEPYRLSIDDDGEVTVASPIEGAYSERRYGLFRFEARNHGEVVGGEPSW